MSPGDSDTAPPPPRRESNPESNRRRRFPSMPKPSRNPIRSETQSGIFIHSRGTFPRLPSLVNFQRARLVSFQQAPTGNPFPKQVRLDPPRKKSGHEGIHQAVQPAGNDSGTIFDQTAEALRYALLDAHRFQWHRLRVEAELS